MSEFPKSELNLVKRKPQRGTYDRGQIYAIVDESLVCHVGITEGTQPLVIPMNFGRLGDTVYLHGAKASRLLEHLANGNQVCMCFTLLDGIVFARSVFNHSMNYRSAMLFGKGRAVTNQEEKLRALEAVTEHIAKGRWGDARLPNRKELEATSVVAVEIESASAKIRTGPPIDDEQDYELPIWAGVLPLRLQTAAPVAEQGVKPGIPLPRYIADFSRHSTATGAYDEV